MESCYGCKRAMARCQSAGLKHLEVAKSCLRSIPPYFPLTPGLLSALTSQKRYSTRLPVAHVARNSGAWPSSQVPCIAKGQHGEAELQDRGTTTTTTPRAPPQRSTPVPFLCHILLAQPQWLALGDGSKHQAGAQLAYHLLNTSLQAEQVSQP